MLVDSRSRRHSSRSSLSMRPPRSSSDHPALSAIGDMITLLWLIQLSPLHSSGTWAQGDSYAGPRSLFQQEVSNDVSRSIRV